MKLDKYLNESVTEINWKTLSSDSKKVINILEDEVNPEYKRAISKLIRDVINNVFQDGFSTGYEEAAQEYGSHGRK